MFESVRRVYKLLNTSLKNSKLLRQQKDLVITSLHAFFLKLCPHYTYQYRVSFHNNFFSHFSNLRALLKPPPCFHVTHPTSPCPFQWASSLNVHFLYFHRNLKSFLYFSCVHKWTGFTDFS